MDRKPKTDSLRSNIRFPSSHPLGIPDLLPFNEEIPSTITFQTWRAEKQDPNSILHFFVDDYRFESFWQHPERHAIRFSKFWGLITPDFSMYADWPLAMQIWNTYRTRWVGRYWQEIGMRVIPSVNWSTPESFNFCFAGIPRYQVLAVGAPHKDCPLDDYQRAFDFMLDYLAPSELLVYGKLPFDTPVPIRVIPPFWEQRLHSLDGRYERQSNGRTKRNKS